jgi:hypothetical protein
MILWESHYIARDVAVTQLLALYNGFPIGLSVSSHQRSIFVWSEKSSIRPLWVDRVGEGFGWENQVPKKKKKFFDLVPDFPTPLEGVGGGRGGRWSRVPTSIQKWTSGVSSQKVQ